MKRKLIFLNTHPIQYFAPLYQAITQDGYFDLEVWYCSKHGLEGELDQQFGQEVKWDIPLLEGYSYKFFKNKSFRPGIYSGYWGLINLGIWQAIKQLPARSIIVVHGWNTFSANLCLLAAKLFGHVSCLRAETPLSLELTRGHTGLWFRKIALQWGLFILVDRFLYIGSQNRLFYEYYSVKNKDLVFTPYAVNNDYFRQNAAKWSVEKQKIIEDIGIVPEAFIVLFCGKLIAKKRPLDLLEALKLISHEHIIHVIFVGDGELREVIEKNAPHSSTKKVSLTGFINQSQISKYYAIADVFVMISDYGETWGLSTNEAMNFGLPVIVSDRTGNKDDLVQNNGIVIETGNAQQLAEAIVSIKTSDSRAMGKKSLKIIDDYSYNRIIEGLRSIK